MVAKPSGTTYQVEVSAVWDGEKGGAALLVDHEHTVDERRWAVTYAASYDRQPLRARLFGGTAGG